MNFRIQLTESAEQTLEDLAKSEPKKHRKVLKTLALMETNLRHPGLKTHKYDSLTGPNEEEVFEAYVENRIPGAFRIFWYYGPDSGVITVFTITPHP